MNSRPLSRIMLSVAIVAWPFGAASAQITSNTGDGVLNAPYRGTINSLREGSSDVPYGEVQSWVEPTGTLEIDSTSNIRAWHDAAQGDPWDRSVLRLYHEFDAAGTEINLSYNTSWETAEFLPNESVLRLSLKAIGTKTLASKTFKIVFNYRLDGGSYHDYTREFVVAPTTGSFCELPGESEAFHYGTPVLDVSVGAARLVVPIGQTADCIGAAYSARENKLGPLQVLDAYNVLLPGAAETGCKTRVSSGCLRAILPSQIGELPGRAISADSTVETTL